MKSNEHASAVFRFRRNSSGRTLAIASFPNVTLRGFPATRYFLHRYKNGAAIRVLR